MKKSELKELIKEEIESVIVNKIKHKSDLFDDDPEIYGKNLVDYMRKQNFRLTELMKQYEYL